MKQKLFIVAIIFFSLQNSFGQVEKENISDIVAAADKGLAVYLEKIPVGKESLYGCHRQC